MSANIREFDVSAPTKVPEKGSEDPKDADLVFAGLWGTWGPLDICPGGSHATGLRTISQGVVKIYDDTALNGVQLLCGANHTEGPTSRVGPQGTWDPKYLCPTGTYIAEFQVLFEPWQQAKDDTAANMVRVRCRAADGTPCPEAGLPMSNCPNGTAVVGIRTRVQEPQGRGDDTALNGVHLRCSKIKQHKQHGGL
eukprot:m51a1_g894 hypothetical protein (195) ;mRNA; r:19459-20496